jgi:hypothetical protein
MKFCFEFKLHYNLPHLDRSWSPSRPQVDGGFFNKKTIEFIVVGEYFSIFNQRLDLARPEHHSSTVKNGILWPDFNGPPIIHRH